MCKLGLIFQERLKIEVKLLLSRKSYMLHRLAQQQMTFSDLEWLFHASHAISAVVKFVLSLS